jgi:hypothetical protein
MVPAPSIRAFPRLSAHFPHLLRARCRARRSVKDVSRQCVKDVMGLNKKRKGGAASSRQLGRKSVDWASLRLAAHADSR